MEKLAGEKCCSNDTAGDGGEEVVHEPKREPSNQDQLNHEVSEGRTEMQIRLALISVHLCRKPVSPCMNQTIF